MRIFVFEYITSGACSDSAMLASLLHEGDMMLNAVVRDLLGIEGVEVLLCRDARLSLPGLSAEVHWVHGDWRKAWRNCLHAADQVLPIAPESDGLLEDLCREVMAAGKPLLNSSADAVALAASKQATLDCLAADGIAVVSSWRADSLPPLPDGAWVVKPDRGEGCRDTHLVANKHALYAFLERRQGMRDWLVQEYLEGQAASLSLMAGSSGVSLLGCNKQRVVQINDGFLLLGCEVNGLKAKPSELQALAQTICRAIPGLWGYVGVDIIITERGPVVLEVNPRLTTSYAGLSQSLGLNVADLLLRLADHPHGLPARYLGGECVNIDLELSHVA